MIIGITGAKNSGKSTFASYLMQSIPDAAAYSLADPMKAVCQMVFGFSSDQLYGPSSKRDAIDPKWGFAPRKALQTLGTEWGRALHEDIWIRHLCENTGKRTIIIPDIRFDNEAKYVLHNGGYVIYLTRNEYPWYRPRWTLHASERGVHPNLRSWTIDNRKLTLPQLRQHAEGFVDIFCR